MTEWALAVRLGMKDAINSRGRYMALHEKVKLKLSRAFKWK